MISAPSGHFDCVPNERVSAEGRVETQNKVLMIAWFTLAACAGCAALHEQERRELGLAEEGTHESSREERSFDTAQLPAYLLGSFDVVDARAHERVLYTFRADGSYRKIRESQASYRSCTTGASVTEAGMARYEDERLTLLPFTGYVRHTDSCQPGRSVEEVLRGLQDETFDVHDMGGSLELIRSGGRSVTHLRRRESPATAAL